MISRAGRVVGVLLAGLLTACTATEIPYPKPAAERARSLPLSEVLAAVRRAPSIRTLPAGLTPSLLAARRDVGFDSDRCEAGPADGRIEACVFGDPAGSTRVVLFGDSHAGMWLPAVAEVARRRHWQLQFFGKPACPAPALTAGNQPACDRFRTFAEQRIQAERPALVLIADDSYDQKGRNGRPVTAAAWRAGLTRTLRGLRRSGARVVVIGDTPVLDQRAPECLAAHPRHVTACSTPRAAATRRVWNSADEQAARATGSGYLPVLPWLCGPVCTPVVGTELVYRDRFNLTATYARTLSGVFEAALRPSDRVLHRLHVAAAARHRLEGFRRHRPFHLGPPDQRGHTGQ